MISIIGKNKVALANTKFVRCIIHDAEKEIVSILYDDNTKTVINEVSEVKIKYVTDNTEIHPNKTK